MEILDNKAVLIRTRTPHKYAVIPKSRIVEDNGSGGYTVAVYWGLDEMRVLKNLGVRKVPSPITRTYDWPGRYIPMAHQIETASFLTLHRRAFCFNEPGTGKTLSALWAADYLMRRGDVRRVLVLCPLSIMHAAWMGDINNSVIHRKSVVAHHSSAMRRVELVQGDYELVIANYEGLNLIADEVNNDGRFDLVIVDEANAYKNPSTQRWKSLAKIVHPHTYLWMMTGTPASQSPVDAYGLAKLVNPSGVPKYATAWRDKVMNKITAFKWAPKTEAKKLVHEALQPAIRFTKAQCLDLPPVVTVTRDVPMSPQQAKYYKLLKEQMLFQTSGETISAVNAGVAVSKLLQISAGAAYTDDKETVEFDASPRMKVLMEILEETDRKVIIFAMFRSSIATITAHLTKNHVPNAQIHGDVNATKRGQIINDFQNTDAVRVLVMQPQATAHGITLTAADTVVFYGPLMSVEMYLQCIARADRKGQESSKVTVVHIQSSPIEVRMFNAMAGKVNDHALLVGLFENELKNI
jgi:SNF2 family DNA or RNA helicase